MTQTPMHVAVAALTLVVAGGLVAGRQPVAAPPPAAAQVPASQAPPASQRQPSEVELSISGDPGTPPRFAVPEFVALTPDAAEVAKVVSAVLWDDLNFEREFYLIPRDTYTTVPQARAPGQIPYNAWRELGADGVVFGTVSKTGNDVRVEVRLFNVRSRQSVFAREYGGSASNPRVYAHTISDEIHQHQRALRGVARTKLTFSSDRNREKVGGTVQDRDVKEVYIADYDGANQRRITVNRTLNITPVWSPDGRAIAYTSYRKGVPDILVAYIYEGRSENPTAGRGSNFLPAWSPDGKRMAFMSSRDGNPEIYVMNADGSGVRRLTNHPAGDVTPTWSPSGTEIAFTSDRAGRAQVFVVSADGLGTPRRISIGEQYADRATWSSGPNNEIAFAAQTGPGYDIKIYDVSTGQTRQITFGEGSNESPAFSPSGRHLAFTSTRAGRAQIFTVARDGRDVRQITRDGNNFTPSWSQ
ncbi:MAG: hypothetical protein FJW23_01365 [Acidimicrobiia bacterium]|nr:hypothetical protein [Acidimicrobiia bacterium]